jgi:hypothetical protein
MPAKPVVSSISAIEKQSSCRANHDGYIDGGVEPFEIPEGGVEGDVESRHDADA